MPQLVEARDCDKRDVAQILGPIILRNIAHTPLLMFAWQSIHNVARNSYFHSVPELLSQVSDIVNMSNLFSRTPSFTRTWCSQYLSKRMLGCAMFTLPDDFLNLFVVEQFSGPGLSSTSRPRLICRSRLY